MECAAGQGGSRLWRCSFGGAALKLFPADPFSQAKLSFSAAVPPSTVMFVDFYARPVASPQRDEGEFLDVDGARIGFFRSPTDAGKAVLWVFHGDAAGGGKWMETSLTLPVDEKSGASESWVRFTLCEDFARQVWDLRVNGALAGANLGFQERQVPHTQAYILMRDATQPVLLDDLSIREEKRQQSALREPGR